MGRLVGIIRFAILSDNTGASLEHLYRLGGRSRVPVLANDNLLQAGTAFKHAKHIRNLMRIEVAEVKLSERLTPTEQLEHRFHLRSIEVFQSCDSVQFMETIEPSFHDSGTCIVEGRVELNHCDLLCKGTP